MKTLKAKLFFSVGAILLFVGIFNIIVSEIWIKRGLSRTGNTIVTYAKEIKDKVEGFSAFLLSLRMVEEAADLERAVYRTPSLVEKGGDSLWQQAREIISYDPEIAFVQVEKEGLPSVCIAPVDAPLLPFFFAPLQDGLLRVKFEDNPGNFIAVPASAIYPGDYLVFSEEALEKKDLHNLPAALKKGIDLAARLVKEPAPAVFTELKMRDGAFNIKDTIPKLFVALTARQDVWVYKMDLIEALLTMPEGAVPMPSGALKIKGENGGYLSAGRVFSTAPTLSKNVSVDAKKGLFLWIRQGSGEKDLDVVREFSLPSGATVRFGFSLGRILKEIALLSGKTLLVKAPGVDLGFRSDGTLFDPKVEKVSEGGGKYIASTVDFALFSLIILTPASEASAVSSFLNQLGHDMVVSVSLSLFAASFISFVIALLWLSNISTKITKPIAILSKAAEHLGSGDYEGIILPVIEHRQDEVAKLTSSFAGMVSALQDRDKIRGVLHKVVSKEISDAILEKNLDFTGEERTVTLLFSDIRSFTKMAEGMSSKTLIPMLNSYMTRMCKIIDATHGVVDKFVGDEIMTLYGAPLELPDQAVLAVEAAVLMMEDLVSWNLERKKENLPGFEIGIGIHTGLVHTGNMGAENRLNYTVIGSNVNLAARMCSAAASGQILITQETFSSKGVQEKFRFRALDPVALKGIEKPVAVYEVIGRA